MREDEADAVIESIARRQNGVATRRQLAGLGISAAAIRRRVVRGRLRRAHRGVYLVPGLATHRSREMAAVLVCGDGVLSHASACVICGFLPERAAITPVEVTVARGHPRHRGVRTYQSALPAEDRMMRDGLPVTTVDRTLADLAATGRPREVERAMAAALDLGAISRRDLECLPDRMRGRRGAAVLRSVLAAGDPALTRSEAEENLLELVRRAGLARPRANARVANLEVDMVWDEERVVVEVDGYAYHGSRAAFERDRDRDASLMAAGFTVFRASARQIQRTPEMVLTRLAQALALARAAHPQAAAARGAPTP